MWHSADHSEYLCRWKGQCDNRSRQLQPRTVLCSIQIDGSWLFPLEVSLGLAVKLGNVHGILSNCFQNGIVMSYSRIPPRFAISLLILIFLLIPFRQSCRIGYNVRDQLSKNIGVLRCNHRTACFSFSCCSSHATRIVWSSKSGIELFFDILHMLSLHNYMDDAISILYISTIKLFYIDNIVH